MIDDPAKYLSAAYARVAAHVDDLIAECQWLHDDLVNVGIMDPALILVKERKITALQSVASNLRSHI